jgi:uncharacterized protein
LLAALDEGDPDHRRSRELLEETKEDLVVPSLVLAELDYWCHRRLGVNAWLSFLGDVIDGAYRYEAPTHTDLVRCAELQREYADLRLGVVDASVITLAERLGEHRVATLDHRHFRTVRPRHVEALTILP